MKILITAGNTITPIDRVRCITNIFSGRTGTLIAREAKSRGHEVVLLTSQPELARAQGLAPTSFRTFDDLEMQLEASIRSRPDAVIHCAAVSDYRIAGVYAPSESTHFDAGTGEWKSNSSAVPHLAGQSAGKIKSNQDELWLRLVRTPKLVDLIRSEWGYRGLLVKFKLEVGLEEAELLRVAEVARLQSQADLMVANTLEGMHTWAYLGPLADRYDRVARRELAGRLLDAVECRR